LEGIAPARRGMPQIEVTFDVDANGIMNISAKDKGTGKENKITIKSDSGLNQEEIDRMIKEAEANAEADKKLKDLIEARNSAEAQVHAAKTDMKEVEDQLTDDEKTKINEAIAAVEEAIKGDDKDLITSKTSELFSAIVPIAQAKTKQSEESTTEPQDEVVDAEFTKKD
jgi:molecular chaperone DnaK